MVKQKIVGATYGKSDPYKSNALITNRAVGIYDFITADGTLTQISKLTIESTITKEDAKDIATGKKTRSAQNTIASLEVLGKVNGDLERRNHPIEPGTLLNLATAKSIETYLRFDVVNGISVGHLLRRTDVPVVISQKMFDTHISVLGMTGKGKTNVSKILLEGIQSWKDARIVIIDPHGEYQGNIIVVDTIKSDIKQADPSVVLGLVRENINSKLEKHLDTIIELIGWYNDKASKGLNKIQLIIKSLDEEDDEAGDKLMAEILKVIHTESIMQKLRDDVLGLGDNTPLVINLKGLEIEQQNAIVGMIAKLILDLGKAGNGTYLFIDECHLYCPQRGTPVSKKPIVNLAQEGRKFQCGIVIMSQRPAKVDKDVISQCNTKFCLAMANDNDIRQVRSSTESATRQMFLEVQKLKVGECLLASPYIERPIFVRVDKYREVKT